MVSLGVCSMVLGDFGECCVIPRDIFEDSMTAIAIVHTAHGFVIAADGRLRFDDESRLQISTQARAIMETETQQKIFQLLAPYEKLTYALRGTIRDPRGYDLLKITESQMKAVSTRRFDDSLSYLKVLGGRINRQINEARRDGTFETFPQTKKMEGTAAWHIASLHFCGYFDNEPCLGQIDFFYYSGDAQFNVHLPQLRSAWMFGSEIVTQRLYGDGFADFIKGITPEPTLENAKIFAQGYIEACSSPLGLEVDEPNCKGIGGHIHMATITKSDGFTWVIKPVVQQR